jgi:hypothetical protein
MTTDGRKEPVSKLSWSTLLVLFLVNIAQAQVKLEWQFKEGETFTVKRVFTQKQSVEIKNKVFKEERAKTWVTAITVKEKTPAGYLLEIKIVSVRFRPARAQRGSPAVGSPAGGVIPPAAGGAAGANLDDKLAEKIKDSTFTAVVTSSGKVTKFEGYDGFIGKVAGKNVEAAKVLRALVPEEAVREELEDIFSFLPGKAVHKGDKWKRETTEPMPPFGSFKSVLEYVLEEDSTSSQGKESGRALIGLTIKMFYRPSEGGDPFRVIKGSLKAEDGKGKIIFNAKEGRLVGTERNVHIRGDLVVESMGKELRMAFASENSWQTSVYIKDEANDD